MQIIPITIFCLVACAKANYHAKYEILRRDFEGYNIPVYSQEMENNAEIAARHSLIYQPHLDNKSGISLYADVDTLQVSKVVTLSNKEESVAAIDHFLACIKENNIMETYQVAEPCTEKTRRVLLKEAMRYTLYGGISVAKFSAEIGCYQVVAFFKFENSKYYNQLRVGLLSKGFNTFPQYKQEVELIAKASSEQDTFSTSLDMFEGRVTHENGHVLVFIHYVMLPYCLTEVVAIYDCVERLQQCDWNEIFGIDMMKKISETYESMPELFASKIPMSGGLSITKQPLTQALKTRLNTARSSVYHFCVCFRLNELSTTDP